MIKFEKIGEEKRLLFRDVEQNQFFIDKDGSFCQKVFAYSYVIISHENGDLYAETVADVDPCEQVIKIFPKGNKLVKIIIE